MVKKNKNKNKKIKKKIKNTFFIIDFLELFSFLNFRSLDVTLDLPTFGLINYSFSKYFYCVSDLN